MTIDAKILKINTHAPVSAPAMAEKAIHGTSEFFIYDKRFINNLKGSISLKTIENTRHIIPQKAIIVNKSECYVF